jgi:hypothetical protein
MRNLSWPTRAVLVAGGVIMLAWPAIFPELFGSVDFLVPLSHAAVLLCCLVAILGGWCHLRERLSKPRRIVLIVGLGALAIWSWVNSVLMRTDDFLVNSGGDLFVSTSYLTVCFSCSLAVLGLGCRLGLPLASCRRRIRGATAALFLALAIQILGIGTILEFSPLTGLGFIAPPYAHETRPRFGAWFFGNSESLPALTYRFEFSEFQITYLFFEVPGRPDEWLGWYLYFVPHREEWPIQTLWDSPTSEEHLPRDSTVLLYWLSAASRYGQPGERYIQVAVHFTIPGILLAIYPLLVFRQWLRQYRRNQRHKKGLCVTCGYNLTGNISGLCPECGSPIEPVGTLAPPAEMASAGPPTCPSCSSRPSGATAK